MSNSVMIGWSGHRPDLFADPDQARSLVETVARRLADASGSVSFICGGQRGVDQWAASAAIDRHLPFTLLLPIPMDSFARDWSRADRAELERLAAAAKALEVVDPHIERGALAFDLRNERVAARSRRLVAVWTGIRQGGSFYTVCAARRRGIPVEEHVLPARPGADLRGRGI